MSRISLLISWVILCTLVACEARAAQSATEVPPRPTTTPNPVLPTLTVLPSPTLPQLPEVVVDVSQPGQVIELQTGQALRVLTPDSTLEWQVDFAQDLLELLTPLGKVSAPGPDGWRFRAIASGTGQIVLTSVVSCATPPCPLMPIRFELNIQVK
jgi:predicted secreted protein